jgi:hypothetical protein
MTSGRLEFAAARMARVRERLSQLTELEPDSVSGLAKIDAG